MASTRYPPEGIRGVLRFSPRQYVWHRGGLFRSVEQEHHYSGPDRKSEGADNIDAIAATEGVDGIFVGPSDLAAALGHLGNASHPDVQKAIQHIFNRASAHGKPSGILAPIEADARRYLEWARRLWLSAAISASSALPLRNWLIPLKNNHHRNKRDD